MVVVEFDIHSVRLHPKHAPRSYGNTKVLHIFISARLKRVLHWKDDPPIKLGCLCSRETPVFMKLVLHDQRKQSKKGCVIPCCSKESYHPTSG